MTPAQRELFLAWLKLEASFWRNREKERALFLDQEAEAKERAEMFEAAQIEFGAKA